MKAKKMILKALSVGVVLVALFLGNAKSVDAASQTAVNSTNQVASSRFFGGYGSSCYKPVYKPIYKPCYKPHYHYSSCYKPCYGYGYGFGYGYGGWYW